MKLTLALLSAFILLVGVTPARAQNHFEKSFAVYFEQGKANQVAYINFPSNISMWGNLEIEITGGYNNQLNRGVLKKRIDIVSNAGVTGYINQEGEVLAASGELGKQWVIGDFDKANARIPIYHLTSSGNTVAIHVRGVLAHPASVSALISALVVTLPADFTGAMPTRTYQHSVEPRLGLGTTTPEHRLDVVGKIRAHEILVNTQKTADYVFEEDYNLRPLDSVARFIKENKHLPEILSAEEMVETNMELGSFQIDLLKKIEELTLYVIDLQEQIKKLETRLQPNK